MLLNGPCLVLGANIAAKLAAALLVKGHHRYKRCWFCQQAHMHTAIKHQEASSRSWPSLLRLLCSCKEGADLFGACRLLLQLRCRCGRPALLCLLACSLLGVNHLQ